MTIVQTLCLALILTDSVAAVAGPPPCAPPALAVQTEFWRDDADPDFARFAGAPPHRLDANRRLGTNRILLGGD